jgi:hypothetical protein
MYLSHVQLWAGEGWDMSNYVTDLPQKLRKQAIDLPVLEGHIDVRVLMNAAARRIETLTEALDFVSEHAREVGDRAVKIGE